MLSFNQAYELVKEHFKKIVLRTETVDLLDSLGRVLAVDIHSDMDMPAFDNSAMDGYAVKYNPKIKKWKVIGEIFAGNFDDTINVDNNSAVSIMTGGKMPQGADTVIAIENIKASINEVIINSDAKFHCGMNVRKKGEDIRSGDIAVIKHTLIRSNILTLTAACGISSVLVYSPLTIGVLSTGDELINYYEKPENDKIRATNSTTLTALINENNMIPMNFGIVKDDRALVKKKLIEVFNNGIDILITSGGVSVGKYDFLQEVLIEMGAKIIFWKVNIKPGKPLLFCEYTIDERTILIFGMPGNPVSTFVNFNIFVQPNIPELYGLPSEPHLKCILTDEIKKHDSKRHFLNGIYTWDNNKNYKVTKTEGQSSGNIPNLGKSNCLIIFDEEKECLKKGEVVECIKI